MTDNIPQLKFLPPVNDYRQYILFSHELFGGNQMILRFLNNYGASVIQHSGSYGHEENLAELAVIKFHGPGPNDWNLCYETEITDDVIGYLTKEECIKLFGRIKNLEELKKIYN